MNLIQPTLDSIVLAGKKVLVRLDFNVPLNQSQQITDATRMVQALPTIKKIIAAKGLPILLSHLGRPKGKTDDTLSLVHVVKKLEELSGCKVVFAQDCIGNSAKKAIAEAKPGEIVLLENLRFCPEEEAGNKAFAQKLALLGDVYINDAFATAHRAHASTATIAQFFEGKRCFGYLMENEINNLNQVLKSGKKPITAILGGAKVSSKITVITKMLDVVNHLILGGGMTFTFIKALGGSVGNSICEDDQMVLLAKSIVQKAAEKGVNLHLPTDVIIADAFSNDANTKFCDAKAIPNGWQGLDVGPDSSRRFDAIIQASKTILWNGPLGVFEMESFAKGTKTLAESIAKATQAGAFSLVGGGDSVAALRQFGTADKMSYISTGGGAMLEFLEGKSLPGITAMLG